MNRFIVEDEHHNSRLDAYLAQVDSTLSRSSWQKHIEDKRVLVNKQLKSASHLLTSGDEVSFMLPAPTTQSSSNLPILYEDEDVIVVNKPEGMLSHSKGGLGKEASVASILASKVEQDETNRAGIVHRLDRATSGVMIVAKNKTTKSYLQKQFQNRTVSKTYIAVVSGNPRDEEATLKWPIERNPKMPSQFRVGSRGKTATTELRVLHKNEHRALVELHPKTGRTHQLRVHLREYGTPIVGDEVYGHESHKRMLLHAHKLSIAIRHNDHKTFEAPIPEGFTV